MLSSLFSILPTLLLGLLSLVNAVPVKPVELLAFAPGILSPSDGTTWVAGANETVAWRTDNVPVEAQNYTLTILLGYFANNSENLDFEHPLATQVPIMQGSVLVTSPPNPLHGYGPNYTVIVIGDSGNASPAFTINPA